MARFRPDGSHANDNSSDDNDDDIRVRPTHSTSIVRTNKKRKKKGRGTRASHNSDDDSSSALSPDSAYDAFGRFFADDRPPPPEGTGAFDSPQNFFFWLLRSLPLFFALHSSRQWLHRARLNTDGALLGTYRPLCGAGCAWGREEEIKASLRGLTMDECGMGADDDDNDDDGAAMALAFESSPYGFKDIQPRETVEGAVERVARWVDAGGEEVQPLVLAFAGPAGTGKR